MQIMTGNSSGPTSQVAAIIKTQRSHAELTWQGMEKIQMLKHLFEFTKSLEDHQQGHNVKQKEGCHHLGVVLTPSSVHFQADSDMR